MREHWKTWWKAAVIRAVKTMAQTAAATIGTAAVLSSVDWKMVVSASILAAAFNGFAGVVETLFG